MEGKPMLAYQLGGWDAYDVLLVDGEEGTPPGGERLARLLAHGPTLRGVERVVAASHYVTAP
jgi:hypothetical protein